jgi:nucleoside-diphosphate kinase
MNLTLAIIKPDAVEGRKIGRILAMLEDESFRIRAIRFVHLDDEQAGEFYAVHRERPFYREDAVARLRSVIGATDPAEAEPGTVRALYAENKERNAIHASDSDETALQELAFFFSARELMGGV